MASRGSQQAVSEQPALLSPMGIGLALVDVNQGCEQDRSPHECNGRAKKRPRDAAYMAAAAKASRARKKALTQALEAELAASQAHPAASLTRS